MRARWQQASFQTCLTVGTRSALFSGAAKAPTHRSPHRRTDTELVQALTSGSRGEPSALDKRHAFCRDLSPPGAAARSPSDALPLRSGFLESARTGRGDPLDSCVTLRDRGRESGESQGGGAGVEDGLGGRGWGGDLWGPLGRGCASILERARSVLGYATRAGRSAGQARPRRQCHDRIL